MPPLFPGQCLYLDSLSEFVLRFTVTYLYPWTFCYSTHVIIRVLLIFFFLWTFKCIPPSFTLGVHHLLTTSLWSVPCSPPLSSFLYLRSFFHALANVKCAQGFCGSWAYSNLCLRSDSSPPLPTPFSSLVCTRCLKSSPPLASCLTSSQYLPISICCMKFPRLGLPRCLLGQTGSWSDTNGNSRRTFGEALT